MISIILLFLVIIFLIINLINDDENNDETVNETVNEIIDKKQPKKVTFNLNNNEIFLIQPKKKTDKFYKIKNKYINAENIKPIQKESIVKDKVEFHNNLYGSKIINNSNFFNSQHEIPNYQKNFIKSNDNLTQNMFKEDLFKNQKGYWENQTIDDYTHRTYNNIQVDKFNKFKNGDHLGKNIANMYDDLTAVNERDSANSFGMSNLRHDDKSVMNKMSNTIYGYSTNCNNEIV